MILSRVIEHLKQQHWTAIVIDFVIVVIGVFIGLQVQEWSNRLEDRRRETQLVSDLLADLEIDRAHFAVALEADERQVGAANASLDGAGLPKLEFDWKRQQRTDIVDYTFDTSAVPDMSAARRDKLWTDVVLGYFPTTSTATYDAMVGAGETRIIDDRQIVRAIQLYHNLTTGLVEQNQKVIAIRANTLVIGAAYGLAPYATMPAGDYFRLVGEKSQLAAAIRIQATFAIYHHGEIKSADAQAVQLQEQLRNYLKGAK
jgi:hypothetical protein